MGSPITNATIWEGTRVWREELEQIKLVRSNNETVFDTLESYFTDKTKFDTELELEVWSGVRATGTLYFKGLFSISDSELDTEFKNFSIKPRVNDDYFDVAEKYDVEYEVDLTHSILETEDIGYATPFTLGAWINGPLSTGFTTFVASGGVISTATTPTGTSANAVNELDAVGIDDIIVVDVSARSIPTGIFVDITTDGGVSITREGQKELVGAQNTFPFTIDTVDVDPWLSIDAARSFNMTFSLRHIDTGDSHANGSAILMEFLESFITGTSFMFLTGFTGNIVSTFLNNDALPTGAPSSITTFIGSNPNGNYASGKSDNVLNESLIGLIKHFIPDSSATNYKISFKQLTDELRDISQVYWFIDADGKFRFEHERYFVASVDDSTPITVPDPGEVDKHLLKYEKGVIASVEQFAWPQAENIDFVGKDIIYNNFETTNNSVKYTISRFTTDIKYLVENPDNASDSGLGLYHGNLLTGLFGGDIYEIVISTGALSGTGISNAVWSWANLHPDYWTWSRMSEDATMNSTGITMDSNIRFLVQEGVRFFYSTAINPYTQINTDLTGGAPVTIRRDLDTDFVELQIGYDPYKL